MAIRPPRWSPGPNGGPPGWVTRPSPPHSQPWGEPIVSRAGQREGMGRPFLPIPCLLLPYSAGRVGPDVCLAEAWRTGPDRVGRVSGVFLGSQVHPPGVDGVADLAVADVVPDTDPIGVGGVGIDIVAEELGLQVVLARRSRITHGTSVERRPTRRATRTHRRGPKDADEPAGGERRFPVGGRERVVDDVQPAAVGRQRRGGVEAAVTVGRNLLGSTPAEARRLPRRHPPWLLIGN